MRKSFTFLPQPSIKLPRRLESRFRRGLKTLSTFDLNSPFLELSKKLILQAWDFSLSAFKTFLKIFLSEVLSFLFEEDKVKYQVSYSLSVLGFQWLFLLSSPWLRLTIYSRNFLCCSQCPLQSPSISITRRPRAAENGEPSTMYCDVWCGETDTPRRPREAQMLDPPRVIRAGPGLSDQQSQAGPRDLKLANLNSWIGIVYVMKLDLVS